MSLKELVDKINLKVLVKGNLQSEVKDAYTGDLLSDVMANAKEGCLWITVQKHLNIIAVATLKNVAAIVITGGREVPVETLQAAEKEGITLLLAQENSFEVSGKVYHLLKAS